MISYNSCTFIGNAGTDAELKTSEEGVSFARFRLAVTTDFHKESQEPPMWLTVIAFRQLADQISEVVKKGSLVLVSGRLAIRSYTDKTNVEKQAVEIIAQTVQVLPVGSRERSESLRNSQAHEAVPTI